MSAAVPDPRFVRATVSEDDEAEALDLVYAWLGGDRAARTLLTRPEYDALVANIAQALADARAEVEARAQAAANQRAAEEIERLAEERAWTTQHDNEVVSVRDLYEQVARLRGELDPVTYDFPPADRAAALASPTPAPHAEEGQ